MSQTAPAAASAASRLRRSALAAAGNAASAFASTVLFTLFAGDFWRNLIGWPAYFMLAFLLLAGSIALVARSRPAFLWRRMPRMLLLFLLLAVASIAWSAYPGASTLGVLVQWATTAAAVFLALCLDWAQLAHALGNAFRWILALSLLFELIVALSVRQPVLPFLAHYPEGPLPGAFYWSRELLFRGGQIQGILGNSNLLAMVALLALIVFAIQFSDRAVRASTGISWIVVAVLTLVLTRSSTVFIAAVFAAAVLGFAVWARRAGPSGRLPVYLTAGGLAIALAVLGTVFASRLPAMLGKSEDLTGRLDIWHSVIGLAQQRPAFGWGWVSYWAPWVEPFRGLAVRNGVQYLQAHNAWLDVWLQLGVVGLVVFVLLVLTTLGRSWFFAVDRPHEGIVDDKPYTALTLLPLLLLAAYLAQSAAESRLLIEAGWATLVLLSVKTKQAAP